MTKKCGGRKYGSELSSKKLGNILKKKSAKMVTELKFIFKNNKISI